MIQRMTTIIYIIRHGEVHNPKQILYGRLPGYGLSEKGRKQIEQSADFLKKKHIDFIYSSPMLRTKQTAEIIRAKLKLPKTQITKYLLEIRTSYQGLPSASLTQDQSELYLSPQPDDETLEEIAKRLRTFIKIVTLKHQGKHIVFVSHGDPIMMLRALVSGLPIEYLSIREGNGFKYIKHGEVLELKIGDDSAASIKTVFIPK